MKIAFGVEHFDSSRGGAERYVWDFARWLVQRGHALTVYASGMPCSMEGVETVRLDGAGRHGSPQERLAASFAEALKTRSFDVVQGFNHVWPGDVLMLHGGVHPAFEEYNALSVPTRAGRMLKALSQRVLPKYRALRRNERMQFGGNSTHFVAVSQRVADDMVRYYPAARGRIHVIHPGIQEAGFGASPALETGRELRVARGVSDETIVYLFVAHNFRLKGLH
ncbi:MAG: glycosyltransferase, partial [Kiritimatiellae bacterium]|nr:glycosyltransferase [Kiritimatiellia bacterium]